MEINEFGQLFATFQKTAFRLETLPQYLVDEEVDAFDAYLHGGARPTDLNSGWINLVTEAASAGKSISRVHAMGEVLTPYLRFELQWFYPYNLQAGEEIRIFQAADPKAAFSDLPYCDFWLFDDSTVVRMDYDDEGRFLRPVDVSDGLERYRQARDIAVRSSQPLEDFLSTADQS